MDAASFISEKTMEIREAVGGEKAICALSGGVDSATVAALAHKAIGGQLVAVFLDDGLMREGEPQSVKTAFAEIGVDVQVLNVEGEFFDALKGKVDPEEKRKAFRDLFYTVFGRTVKQSGARVLLQGTIKADIIETKGGVKSQHNVLEQIGIDPQAYGFKVLEPLKDLFKPEVREVCKALGLRESIWNRMPFPGPALATRCVGEVTRERIAALRKATQIVEEETASVEAFQKFAVLLNDMATGITRDGKRSFGQIIVVRCVNSKDAMTAEPTLVPMPTLMKIRERITREIPNVTRVLYDLTPKPPATIEYI